MQSLYRIAFLLALAGWMASVLVHGATLAGVDVASRIPFVTGLHLGIFVVWLPAALETKRHQKGQPLRTRNPLAALRRLMPDTPDWLRLLALAGFYYAVVNFFLSFVFSGTYQASTNRVSALSELRGFSGHWQAFYGLAVAALYRYRPGGVTGEDEEEQPSSKLP